MKFTDISKFFKEQKKMLLPIFVILFFSLLFTIIIELTDAFLSISLNTSWFNCLTFLIAFVSLSNFTLTFFTYSQSKDYKMLTSGTTFLIVGLLHWNILIASVNGTINESSISYWLLTGIINLFTFIFLTLQKQKPYKGFNKIHLLFISLVSLFLSYFFIKIIPPDIARLSSTGLGTVSIIIILVLSISYIAILLLSLKRYSEKKDKIYITMGCAFLLMAVSCISLLRIKNVPDIRLLLCQVYQLLSYAVIFRVYFVQCIQRPYVLLAETKKELNEYLEKLDKLVDIRTKELRNINEKLMADQEIARGMQLSMLPETLPENEYVSFASGYIPAENLSGDFYNVFKIDNTRFGICIGDVSGHGVSAAMLSIFTFQKMQSLLEEEGGEGMAIPSLVLKHLYDSFNAANFNEDMYVVMLYGVFDYTTGIFSYASGGLNTAPLRIRPDGSIQELDNDGFAICKLGNLITPKFVNHQILLFPGDRLVLYTDGLIDARNSENDEYSLKRLKKAIQRYYKWDTERLIKSIEKDVTNYVGGRLTDDVTILAIDVLPPF